MSVKTYLDCEWLILVEPSYVVQFQVITYNETPKCSLNTTDCRCSSIQVKNHYLCFVLGLSIGETHCKWSIICLQYGKVENLYTVKLFEGENCVL